MRIRERFNPRAPCGARRMHSLDRHRRCSISTHAPLAGRDLTAMYIRRREAGISTHAPLAGRDHFFSCHASATVRFQPTRPLRGATVSQAVRPENDCKFQPTRPLRGATGPGYTINPSPTDFNPRAPCGARPPARYLTTRREVISTHAPLAGRDVSARRYRANVKHFNPRAPCGARRWWSCQMPRKPRFQPTRPLRGATRRSRPQLHRLDFNPRAPCGARQYLGCTVSDLLGISTHAPLAGRDACQDKCPDYLA